MSKLTHGKLLSVAMAVLLSAAVSWNLAIAQTKTGAVKGKPAAAEGDDAGPGPNKGKGRLPPYYKDIVDAKQKDKIYALQAEFNAKIDALEDQLKKLADERDAAVENVLSPEQKEKLKKAKEDAAAKKKKKAPDDKPADEKTGEPKAAPKSAN